MAEKIINSRIQLKTDTSSNWSKATNFIPKKGEFIFYSDLQKFKIGDGIKKISKLDFVNEDAKIATQNEAGLMSSADKTKLDGIATGANKYVLPTASSTTLGGVKSGSSVTSTTGLTACPIIGGVPYYKAGGGNMVIKYFSPASPVDDMDVMHTHGTLTESQYESYANAEVLKIKRVYGTYDEYEYLYKNWSGFNNDMNREEDSSYLNESYQLNFY